METALIIEDSASDLAIIKSYLQQQGFKVATAKSGEEALEKICKDLPNLIILDVVLPDLSGYEICRTLKAEAKTSKIPIILCSTKESELDKFWGMKQGADVYLRKPVVQEELIRVIKQYQVPTQPTNKFTQKIFENLTMIKASALEQQLQNFVRKTPEVQGAILVSPDGLPISSVLPAVLDEERTAAMSAAMLSLGERIAEDLARGAIERILVEGEKGYSILVGCGEEVVLLILASKEAKQGILFLAIKRLVEEIRTLLS